MSHFRGQTTRDGSTRSMNFPILIGTSVVLTSANRYHCLHQPPILSNITPRAVRYSTLRETTSSWLKLILITWLKTKRLTSRKVGGWTSASRLCDILPHKPSYSAASRFSEPTAWCDPLPKVLENSERGVCRFVQGGRNRDVTWVKSAIRTGRTPKFSRSTSKKTAATVYVTFTP